MQMLTTKFKLTLCIALFACVEICSAETSFTDYFLIESEIDTFMADKITQHYSEDSSSNAEQQKSELFKLESQLASIQNKNISSPVYWFIKGLNDRNIASYYASMNKPILAKQYINNKNQAYKKALELSKNDPESLSTAIYNTMKHGLPEDLKIEATQAELSQGGNGDNESAYWYLHWSNVDLLQKAGRHEEAKAAFELMQEEMQAAKVDMGIYSELNTQIEKQTFNKAEQTQDNPTISTKSTDNETTLFSKDMLIPGLIFISLLSLFLVTIYELFFKKRRSKTK